MGVGEAGSNPPSHSIIADLYKPEERARAMGIFALGVNFGVMLGYLIGGWVNEWLDWRWAFIIAGLPGLLIAGLIRFTMREPPRGYAEGIADQPRAPPFSSVARFMFRSPAMRQVLAANALISLAGYAAIAWVPVYLGRVHEMGTGQIGTLLALAIGIGGGLGTYFGGYFADKLAVRSQGWRAWVVFVALLIYCPFAVLAYLADTPTTAFLFFLVPAIVGGAYIGPNYALVQSMTPLEMRSVAAAINLFTLNIIGLGLGPLSVGIISDYTMATAGVDSVRYGLLFTVAIMVWGAAHQWRLGSIIAKDPSIAGA